jgi:hypothetical protein
MRDRGAGLSESIASALLPVLFAAVCWLGATVSSAVVSPAVAFAKEPTSVRIGGPVEVLATDRRPFLVPIQFVHDGTASAVHIGLDYDELMLHYTDSPSVGGAVGQAPWEVIHHESTGYLELLVPFDATAGGRTSEALLIQLEFELRDLSTSRRSGYSARETARLDLNDLDTYFVASRDQSAVRPGQVLDGGVTVFFRDLLEIGSARMTADRKEFHIPVYVTHLKQENIVFYMGLDYDEFYLDLVGVKPVWDLLVKTELRYDRKTGPSQKAWVEVPFVHGAYPAVLRRHLLDLVFDYRVEDQIPPDDVLRIVPILAGSYVNGDDGPSGQVEEGTIYLILPEFVRGDANGSGTVDLNDAVNILGYCLLGGGADGGSPPCLDALDADASGQIEVTDAILVLGYLFLGGTSPEMPFPEPGPSPPGLPRLKCENEVSEFEPLPFPEER